MSNREQIKTLQQLGLPLFLTSDLNQPSSKYKFFIPGQQFLGSGSAKDKSGNGADAAFGSTQTDGEAWANVGYMSTVAGANKGFTIPPAKVLFDLATQSIIFSTKMKKAAPVSAEAVCGRANGVTGGSAAYGFYLSVRAASSSVSKIRPVLNTSTGVITGLADSTATFAEAAATDHVVTLAIDAVTKSVFLWCDGTLSNTYAAAYTGSTANSPVPVPFGFGASTGVLNDTAVAMQFNGAHLLVMDGGLPTNMGMVAQKLAGAPLLYLTNADLQF